MTTKELLHIQPPRDTHGFSKLAPDLVVEVPSRDERPGKVLAMCSRGAREVLAMCSRCARDVRRLAPHRVQVGMGG